MSWTTSSGSLLACNSTVELEIKWLKNLAPSSSPDRPEWLLVLAALLGGLVVGAGVKLADQSGLPGVGLIGTHFGVWIVGATLIAAWSLSWHRAVLYTVTFLLAMVAAYYVSQMMLFGFFSTNLFIAWVAVALLLTPPFAILANQARGTGWRSVLGASVPIGLLLQEAYSLRWRLSDNADYQILFVFDIMSAATLLLLLPTDSTHRLRVILLTPLITIAAHLGFNYILPVVLGTL